MTEPFCLSEIGSERATVGDGNKIVTFDGRTHIVWQDITREGYMNRVRSYDRAKAEWTDPLDLGVGLDNHARPIITVDGDGYLHVVLGGHNSSVTWRRSTRPNDTSSWEDPVPIGEGTYPVLLCGPDGTLYLTLRANRHAGVDLYVKPLNDEWTLRSRIVKNAEEYREAYGAFHMQMMMGPDGVIHAAIDFFEGQDEVGRGLHMAVCYCKSRDGGYSWEKADGTAIAIPARPEGMDTVARSIASRVEPLPRPEDINCAMLVDSASAPHLLWLSHRNAPGELSLVQFGEDGTQTLNRLHPVLESEWPDYRVTGARATILSDDTIYLLVELSPLNDQWIEGRPSREMGMVERDDLCLALVKTTDFGKTCEVETAIAPGKAFNSPNMEHGVGANQMEPGRCPTFVYFDGTRGYPGGGDYYEKPVAEMLAAGEFVENRVYVMLSS